MFEEIEFGLGQKEEVEETEVVSAGLQFHMGDELVGKNNNRETGQDL